MKRSKKSSETSRLPRLVTFGLQNIDASVPLDNFLEYIAVFTAAGLGVVLTVDRDVAKRRYKVGADFLTLPTHLSELERLELYGQLIEVTKAFAATHLSKATKGAVHD